MLAEDWAILVVRVPVQAAGIAGLDRVVCRPVQGSNAHSACATLCCPHLVDYARKGSGQGGSGGMVLRQTHELALLSKVPLAQELRAVAPNRPPEFSRHSAGLLRMLHFRKESDG